MTAGRASRTAVAVLMGLYVALAAIGPAADLWLGPAPAPLVKG